MKKINLIVLLTFIFNLFISNTVFADNSIQIDGTEYTRTTGTVSSITYNTLANLSANSSATYSFSTTENGKYTFVLNASSTQSSSTITANVDGEEIYSSTNSFSGATSFGGITLGEVNMTSGSHTIQVAVDKQVFINYITVTKTGDYETPAWSQNEILEAKDYVSSEGEVAIQGDIVTATQASLNYSAKIDDYDEYLVSLNCKGLEQNVEIYVNGVLYASRADTASEDFSDVRIGTIRLNDGENTVTVKNSGSLEIKKIKFNQIIKSALGKEDFDGEEFVISAPEYIRANKDINIGQVNKQGEIFDVTHNNNGDQMVYSVNVPKTALYKVVLRYQSQALDNDVFTANIGNETISYNLIEKSGEETYTPETIDVINLEQGTYEMTVSVSGYMTIGFIGFYEIYPGISFMGAFAKDESLINGKTIPRGTDSFELYYNNGLNKSLSNNVRVVDEDSEEINLTTEVVDNVLKVKLNETLDFEEEYTMTVNNLSNEYGVLGNNSKTIDFITSDSSNDEGNGSVEITDKSAVYENMTVKGIVYSGDGLPISGRKVFLKNSENTLVAETVSGENGIFTINYQIESVQTGLLNFTVADEYTQTPQPVSITYMSQSKETEICGAIKGTTDWSEVYDVFDSYKTELAISPDSDLGGIADTSKFYNHFVGQTYNSSEDLLTAYEKYIDFEKLNQTDSSSVVEDILTDESALSAIGINKEKVDAVVNSKTTFYAETASIPICNSIEEYLTEFNEVLNTALAREHSKTAVNPDVSDISVRIGQAALLPVMFVENISDISKVNYIVEVSDSSILNNLKVTPIDGITETHTTSDKILETEFIFNTVQEGKAFGQIALSIPQAGTYTVKVSGEVIYNVNDIEFSTVINEKTITVTASAGTESNGNTPSNDAGGNGGSAGGFDYSNAGKNPVIVPGVTPTKYEFSDLASFSWAEESIYELLNAEIISKSEENCFYPGRNVTREEFLKMLMIASGLVDENAVCAFEDVSQDEWYYVYVASAYEAGIVNGISNTEFGVGLDITREDMCVMVNNVLKLKGISAESTNDGSFADTIEIADYATEAVYVMKNIGIVNGVGDNKFAPKSALTRAMAAKVIYEMRKAV